MKRHFFILILTSLSLSPCLAQTEVTTQEAKSLYKATTKKRVSVHDPSVVYEPNSKRYYILGSHKSGAYTSDLQNWTWAAPTWSPNNNATAFTTPAVNTVKKGGVDVAMPAFNAMGWSARSDASYNIDGNMWAPDVIWNERMQKWCMYLSINGDSWHSSIILLTSNSIQGPYKYQAPVVICGFKDSQHSYKDTDLELVIGTQSSLPSRYNVGNNWGRRWPHTIDPAVFYDEEGNLWMAYGSWSGGIWMLQLDEETGLRDYDVVYPSTNGSSDGVTSDPYFGKKIAGGYYVSGEGAYIEHIGNYYYLFVSYGFLDQKGGYEMRVFRSESPDGPYKDPGNRDAIFTSYSLNYGASAQARGAKLIGPYSHWGFMPQGERAQGHNSIIAAQDGRTYLVYHTRFCNDNKDTDEGHQVRVHQVFVNKDGWLVAAPFEYNGEQTTDADIATTQAFTREELCGTYQVLIHKFANDHNNLEQVEPISLTLSADGTISGDRIGSWAIEEGTSYVTLTVAGVKYSGVMLEETMDEQSLHATAITALSASGVGLWAYKYAPKYALAWQVNNQKSPLPTNGDIKRNYDLMSMLVADNVELAWTSSNPEAISNYGRYNPSAITNDASLTLTAQLTTPGYYWEQAYSVVARSEDNSRSTFNWAGGLMAHYGFDDDALANTFNTNETAQLKRNSTTSLPVLDEGDQLRNGRVLHLNFGANGKESYATMPNPLFGKSLSDGASLSFFVKRTDNNLWDALYGFVNGNARLYMTGNLYTGYNNGSGAWLDINHPNTVQPTSLTTGLWHFVTITFSPTATSTTGGVTVYVDGVTQRNDKFNGEIDGKSITSKATFDYTLMLSLIAESPELWLGRGSFWGSPDACFDDIIFHDRALTLSEAMGLHQMVNRATPLKDEVEAVQGITPIEVNASERLSQPYDLQGRPASSLSNKPGIHIIGGRKVVIP